MRAFAFVFVVCVLVASFVSAEIPVATYSIVARDPQTGEMGVAVQSHAFSVGTRVTWAEAGVGAVATQSFVDVSYGPLGLELMRAGKTAPDALRALLAGDQNPDVRQVAMIDANGNVLAHTGKKCIQAAGNQIGKDYSVQANLMSNATVWPAMAKAFESTKGPLAERMLAALDAAQAAGGDIRGMQSAAILIVSGKKTGVWWQDRVMDLRVDDNPEPLKELRRLVNLHTAFSHSDEGDVYLAANKTEDAIREYETAANLAPNDNELLFWYAQSIYKVDEKKSLELFQKVFQRDRRWVDLIDRLPAADLLPADAVAKIKAVAPR